MAFEKMSCKLVLMIREGSMAELETTQGQDKNTPDLGDGLDRSLQLDISLPRSCRGGLTYHTWTDAVVLIAPSECFELSSVHFTALSNILVCLDADADTYVAGRPIQGLDHSMQLNISFVNLTGGVVSR